MSTIDSLESLRIKINEKINSNVFLSYAKTLWDKYKYVVIFVIAIILIAFIEVRVATCTSECSYTLDKYQIHQMSPPCLRLPDNVYIYVYNSNIYNMREVEDKINIKGYNKLVVGEHIMDQITKPVNKIKEGFKKVFISGTPVNTIGNNILNGCKLKDVINPLNSFNNFDSSWRVLYPEGLHMNCFTSGGTIYFSR